MLNSSGSDAHNATPPIRLNRRRFLGSSVAASWAFSQGRNAESAENRRPVRLGLIGLGTRGTTLLRSLLELPEAEIVALADLEQRHLNRAQGIVEKARGSRPFASSKIDSFLERSDVEAVVVSIPNDLHAYVYEKALRNKKHIYAEKPLGLTLIQCDRLIQESAHHPDQIVHVGFQRRSNPRFVAGIDLIRNGDLGVPFIARFSWTSSNGPIQGHQGWLSQRRRSGDWMLEQAIHLLDVLNWIKGSPPSQVFGSRPLSMGDGVESDRDVTDLYAATLLWPDGFQGTIHHSWLDPADEAFTGMHQQVVGSEGGIDFSSGKVTYRNRSRSRRTICPGTIPDTRLALERFLTAIQSETPQPPPISLKEARDATLSALMVRQAVDERRLVSRQDLAIEH